jgi:hypothetical protein
MNSASHIYSSPSQVVADDRDPDSTPSAPDRLPSVTPQPDLEPDYDLIQLCEDLATISPCDHPTQ